MVWHRKDAQFTVRSILKRKKNERCNFVCFLYHFQWKTNVLLQEKGEVTGAVPPSQCLHHTEMLFLHVVFGHAGSLHHWAVSRDSDAPSFWSCNQRKVYF